MLALTSTAGGGGLHAFYLSRYLPPSLFELTVAFGPGYPLDVQFDRLGIRVVRLGMSRSISPLRNLRAFFEMYRLIKGGNFHIVCTACSVAGLLGRVAAFVAGVRPSVFVIHAFASRPFRSRSLKYLLSLVERCLDPLTTWYIAVSEHSKRYGVEHGIMPAHKVKVIHNGIPLEDRVAVPQAEVRAEFMLGPGVPVVGTIGRFEPQKGMSFFLRAAALVRERVPDAEFLIIGDGPLRDELIGLARDLKIWDAVRFTGWRDDISRLLCGMDVFCLPSLWEQFPFVVLEAMAMGRPVVATSVDGVPEAVVPGETGMLAPPENPEALASSIVNLLRNPELARRFGDAARRRVEERFTIQEMIRRYVEFFQEIRPTGEAAGAPVIGHPVREGLP